MGRRKPHKIVIREDRLSKLDGTKMEVALWLLARGKVEDRTQRSQPAPPRIDQEPDSLVDRTDADDEPQTREPA